MFAVVFLTGWKGRRQGLLVSGSFCAGAFLSRRTMASPRRVRDSAPGISPTTLRRQNVDLQRPALRLGVPESVCVRYYYSLLCFLSLYLFLSIRRFSFSLSLSLLAFPPSSSSSTHDFLYPSASLVPLPSLKTRSPARPQPLRLARPRGDKPKVTGRRLIATRVSGAAGGLCKNATASCTVTRGGQRTERTTGRCETTKE